MDLVDVFPTFSDTPQTYFLVMLVMSPFSGARNPLTQAGRILNLSTWRSPNLWPSIYAPGMICYHDVQKTQGNRCMKVCAFDII